ncbi:unnamed protein product [Auanema sp. JU1783]|nr:unnamed protein product [Auanema sp. JU1783]
MYLLQDINQPATGPHNNDTPPHACCHRPAAVHRTTRTPPLFIIHQPSACTAVLTSVDCPMPHPYEIIWLPASRPPCLHPGQPIFEWPTSNCSLKLVELHSNQISVDNEGTVYAKERLCFYYTYEVIHYSFTCNTDTQKTSSLRLGHSIFTKQQRRVKRWLRRRNPNSASIHFQQERYVKELPEDIEVNSLILSVRATHATNEPIYYSMVAPQDSRSQNIFTLDTVSGDIRLAKSLDREILDKHVLKVTAYERIDSTVSSSTTVIIDVLDVQDNSPVFERDSYFSDIREDAPMGTTVLSVFARDLDIGENGEVEYSLGDGEGSEYLTIQPKSGVIQTAAPLDREILSLIRLDVVATDKGVPPRKSSALVEIGIIDVNDNPPVFEKDFYNVTVSENATLPAIIATVKATDKDSGVNGQVHYSLVTSTSLPITIDYSTGEVILREKLDAKYSPFTILVRAKDGAQPALTSTVSLTLNIEDINDHAPRFIASQKQIFLEENVAVGEEVAKVYAIDDDSGSNGQVRYSLSGSQDFAINENSGVIKTTRLLDRERESSYELQITASDLGVPSQNTSTIMNVMIRDVNDNAPQFENNEYNISVSEDTERGSQILTLLATDKDENQKISYRIEQATKEVVALIDMGEQGALLTLSAPVHSSDDKIRVEISATDQGGLHNKTIVNIYVDDINSPPYFTQHPFSVRIPEDSPVGFHVMTIHAEDSDRGSNAEITYYMKSEDFEIDAGTGQIRTKKELDRESQESYTLTVVASDGALPPLNSSTQVEVIVDDVNDNSPQFSAASYEASISEDIAVGTSFMQISAVDSDVGNNGIVDYYMNDSDATVMLDLFRLDRTSGTLRVSGKLDRELYPKLVLPVIARDRGTHSLSSSSEIIITLQDINDNAPIFEHSSFDLYIAENSAVGSLVGTIQAHDPDEGENAVMQFRIFGGTDAKLFDIETDPDQPGLVRILTRAEFDYEAKTNKFYLEVQASSGQLSSTVPVRVHVSDVNDNRPILKDFIVYLNRYENEALSLDVGMIPAFDPDQNATLEYSMEENDVVYSDKYSGRMTLKQLWKRNFDASFKTCVSDGPNTVCSTCRFIHTYVHSNWLREAVTVSIDKISLDDFWDPAVFNRFRQSVSTLDEWDPSFIHVLGADPVKNGLHVHFCVVSKGKLMRSWKVEDVLKSEFHRLERISLLRINVIRDESCSKEPCPFYQKCRQTLKYINNKEFHETDNFIAKTIKTLQTFICECPTGFTSSLDHPDQCDLRLDQCFNNPCKNNGTCVSLENGYRCECHKSWSGINCDVPNVSLTCLPGYCMSDSSCDLVGKEMKCRHCPFNETDTDERCRLRSLTFNGNSAINVNNDLSRMDWTLELSISTIAHDGIILYTGHEESDHLELSISDRILKAQFSLGDKKKVVRMESDRHNRINDGQWHRITLTYYDRKLTILLDDCDAFSSLHANGEKSCAAQGKIDLPEKCLDPAVPCYRFLDLSNGIFLGGRPSSNQIIENGYSGCISNFTLNGKLIDFSAISDMYRIGNVKEGCPALSDFCSNVATCSDNSKCVNRWNGFNCRCSHSVHSTNSCESEAVSLSKPISLSDDESFVIYEANEAAVPFSLSFEFRTSRVDTQVIVIEFDQRNTFYRLQVDDGIIRVWVGQNSMIVPMPEFNPGHWMRVHVDFDEEEITTSIDGIYTVVYKKSLLVDLNAALIYTGLAPSTGHPSRFEGCLRDLFVNGRLLPVKEKGKVRAGCIVGNRCSISGVCPSESKCHREWDRHRCQCHKGFVGDTCMPVCSIKGICGSEGVCQVTNASSGYECQCPNGRSGSNCEKNTPEQICPSGWYGEFPYCRACNCNDAYGFTSQCDRKTGDCLCEKLFFLKNSRCVPCECGLGAQSMDCSLNGQCLCTGQAFGRRCDRCSDPQHVLDVKTLKCIPLRDRCPSQIEDGIQWPTTLKGVVARASCRGQETGLATRLCDKSGHWQEVNNWNCTKPEYGLMVNKFDALDSYELLSMLHNATNLETTIRGRNFEIARSAGERIIENELKLKPHTRVHMRDYHFTQSLVLAIDKILDSENPLEYLALVQRLASYGRSIFDIHNRVTFLQPFAVISDTIIFAIDNLDFDNVVPKFNNFLDDRSPSFPRVFIETRHSDKIFYSILPTPRCARCENPIVIVFANTTSRIRVEFPLSEENGWKYPECVRLHEKTYSSWSTDAVSLVGLNLTHVVCEFSKQGIYTLLVKNNKGAYLRLAHSDNISSPVLAVIALLLLTLSFICTVIKKNIKTQLIRMGFILFFTLNAANIYFVHKISINQVFCPVRNAVLSFTTSSPFAWLFLYSLHLYRMLADANPKSSTTVCLLIGLVLPCLLSCGSFLFAAQCSFMPSEWLFWLLLIPIILFLLLSFYASATSFLVSMNKQYDVVVVKFSLRKALLQHFILSSLTLLHTGLSLSLPHLPIPPPLRELICNIVLVVVSLYILIWSFSPSGKTAATADMWLEDPQKNGLIESTCAPDIHSPLLGVERVDVRNTSEWMPDVIPVDPYLTSTPLPNHRSAAVPEYSTPVTRLDNPLANTILSPAERILSESKFRCEEDDVDAAYYTYTIQRRRQNTTFSK